MLDENVLYLHKCIIFFKHVVISNLWVLYLNVIYAILNHKLHNELHNLTIAIVFYNIVQLDCSF